MEYRPLGNTDLKVSSLCLGTMTWGNQNSAEEGFAQMDLALDRGINFFDTADFTLLFFDHIERPTTRFAIALIHT